MTGIASPKFLVEAIMTVKSSQFTTTAGMLSADEEGHKEICVLSGRFSSESDSKEYTNLPFLASTSFPSMIFVRFPPFFRRYAISERRTRSCSA